MVSDNSIPLFMSKSVLLKILGKNIGCGIYIDLQKAFDTVEHTWLAKLEHYGIHGIANEWFKFYLFDRKQFVYINGHVSNKASINYGVP